MSLGAATFSSVNFSDCICIELTYRNAWHAICEFDPELFRIVIQGLLLLTNSVKGKGREMIAAASESSYAIDDALVGKPKSLTRILIVSGEGL